MKHILALDPANVTGWACSDGTSGVIDIARGGHRLATFQDFLNGFIKTHPGIELIAYENAGFGAGKRQMHTMKSLNELIGVIRLCADVHRIKTMAFVPSTIKKFATGSGNADKDQMIRACQRLLNKTPCDNNEADAIWILELAKRPDCWPIKKPRKAKKKTFTKGPQRGLF